MGKKLIGIAVIAIMLFGIFGLAGCGNVSLAEYKTEGKASIDTHVATKTQGNYSTDKWAELLNVATEGKQAVEGATNKDAIDTAVNNTKIAINAVEEEREMADFVLTISVDKTTVTHGQKITASAVLKNNSGQSQDIAFFQPVISPLYSCWTIPGWYFYEDIHVQFPEIPPSYLLDKDDSTSFSDFLWVDNEQEKGVFELQLCFNIYLNFGQPNEEIVIVKSNKINITVQ